MSESGFVYVISGRYQKIGHSRNPKGRLAGFKTASPYPLTLSFELECYMAERAERLAHQQLAHKRLAGEWFDVSAEDAILAVKDAVANVQGRRARVSEVKTLEPGDAELESLKAENASLQRLAWEMLKLLQDVQHCVAYQYDTTETIVLHRETEHRILDLMQINGLETYWCGAFEPPRPLEDTIEPFDDGWSPFKKEASS